MIYIPPLTTLEQVNLTHPWMGKNWVVKQIPYRSTQMPCRCCGASRPSKGFKEPDEIHIHSLLSGAAYCVLEKNKNNEYEDIEEWKKAWQECFDHMLNGCDEK